MSFIVVGALMPLIGYVAPMPLRQGPATTAVGDAPDTVATQPGVS